MEGLDFLLTAIGFSVLGYGLCYITLSVKHKSRTKNVNFETPLQSREPSIQQHSRQQQQRHSA